MSKKYIAEFIGTFALSLVVLIVASSVATPIALPIIVGLTLALFVYTIGTISGCHINPSVTIGLWSVKKIPTIDALYYIIAQLLGALLAFTTAGYFDIVGPVMVTEFSFKVFLAEMIGAFFFNFGIASVIYGKAKDQMSGIVVGGSLTFGVLVASLLGATGILNPAVALTLSSMTFVYTVAPICGAVLGFYVYRTLLDTNN